MDDATRSYLRNAVVAALGDKNDAAASELVALLHSDPQHSVACLPQAVPTHSPAVNVIDGGPRDITYWSHFIRENFLPFMAQAGRRGFTSPELIVWCQHLEQFQLTEGDVDEDARGVPVWRTRLSRGLAQLVQQGFLSSEHNSKRYTLNPVALSPAPAQLQLVEATAVI